MCDYVIVSLRVQKFHSNLGQEFFQDLGTSSWQFSNIAGNLKKMFGNLQKIAILLITKAVHSLKCPLLSGL